MVRRVICIALNHLTINLMLIQEKILTDLLLTCLKLIPFKIKSEANHEAIPWSVDLFYKVLLLIGVAASKSLATPYLH